MKILHLSDLHFGTETDALVNSLSSIIDKLSPNLVIISGDFTQIASEEEYISAQSFMARLHVPVFCVPGNHDISRYNLFERFTDPFKGYKRFIAKDLDPFLQLDNIAIQGINSARPILPHWNWANGAVSEKQIQKMSRNLCAGDHVKICVLHHPVHTSDVASIPVKVYGAEKFIKTIDQIGVDLVLTGHVHNASVTQIDKTIYISASTALSSRLRGEENGFNVININNRSVNIDHFVFDRRENFKKDMQHSFSLRDL